MAPPSNDLTLFILGPTSWEEEKALSLSGGRDKEGQGRAQQVHMAGDEVGAGLCHSRRQAGRLEAKKPRPGQMPQSAGLPAPLVPAQLCTPPYLDSPMCHGEADVPSYHLWGSMWKICRKRPGRQVEEALPRIAYARDLAAQRSQARRDARESHVEQCLPEPTPIKTGRPARPGGGRDLPHAGLTL